MKKTIILCALLVANVTAFSQFVAKMEVKEIIPGLCDMHEVYALFPVSGQVEAPCPVTNEEIEKRLNSEVTYIKENPKYKGDGMVSLIINCKGVVVQCKMDNKTKSEELDKQIVAVFNSLGTWKAGTLNGKEVDSVRLFSFSIKKGVFKL
jgi:hypothetical protein